MAGATWGQVAEVTGYHDQASAHRAVKNYFGTTPHPDAALAREMWRDRLEVLWRQVLKDAEQLRPGAVRAGVAVVQRAAALDGLDAPQQFEIAPMGDAARYGGDGPDAARPSTAGCGP